jgi:hypothetical protein
MSGLETDGRSIKSIVQIGMQMLLYHGPTVATRVVRFLWSIRGIVVMVSISLVDAFTTYPIDERDPVPAVMTRWLLQLAKMASSYNGPFVLVCDALIAPFDRWEIAIGRWRRDRNHTLSPLKPHKYLPLRHPRNIRLLQLNRRCLFSMPSCELIEVPLDNAPPFEAISYTWGGETPNIPVEVDGYEMLVTSSVDELLFYQRSIFTSKLFWIDAICINQKVSDDNKEKNHQLPLMTEIYQRASRVVVWLGAPESRKDTYLVRKMIGTINYLEWYKSANAVFPILFDNEEEAFMAIGKLLRHPWFERIWVVQEVAVGKTVHVMYHGTCTQWEVLAAVVKRLSTDTEFRRRLQYHNSPKVSSTSTPDRKLPRSQILSTIEQARAVQIATISLIRDSVQTHYFSCLSTILAMTSIYKSTNPRDKVFAVLGIARGGRALPFKRDYNENVEKLFLKATAFVLASEDWFFLFSYTGIGYESNSRLPPSEPTARLPSWVPDYTSDRQAGHRAPRPTTALLWKLWGHTGKVTFTRDERVIQVQIFAFDFIRHLGPILKSRNSTSHPPNPNVPIETVTSQSEYYRTVTSEDDPSTWYFSARQFARETLASTGKSEESLDQEFWELCMSQYEGLNPGPVPRLYPPLSLKARKLFEKCLVTDPDWWPKKSRIGSGFDPEFWMMDYLERIFTCSVSGKAFCITAADKMGLVPPLAKKGDTLVHVKGGFIPMVLRRKSPGSKRAELVGTCDVLHEQDVYFGSNWEDWLLE